MGETCLLVITLVDLVLCRWKDSRNEILNDRFGLQRNGSIVGETVTGDVSFSL